MLWAAEQAEQGSRLPGDCPVGVQGEGRQWAAARQSSCSAGPTERLTCARHRREPSSTGHLTHILITLGREDYFIPISQVKRQLHREVEQLPRATQLQKQIRGSTQGPCSRAHSPNCQTQGLSSAAEAHSHIFGTKTLLGLPTPAPMCEGRTPTAAPGPQAWFTVVTETARLVPEHTL